MSVADRKLKAIRSILENDTYDVTSALYQFLEVRLNTLSVDALESLELLVRFKTKTQETASVLDVAQALGHHDGHDWVQ